MIGRIELYAICCSKLPLRLVNKLDLDLDEIKWNFIDPELVSDTVAAIKNIEINYTVDTNNYMLVTVVTKKCYTNMNKLYSSYK